MQRQSLKSNFLNKKSNKTLNLVLKRMSGEAAATYPKVAVERHLVETFIHAV